MLSSLSLFVCALICGVFWRVDIYILAVKSGSFISVSLSGVRVFVMEKVELIEILAKSQEKILSCVDSKLQNLKRSISEDQEDCVRSVVKKVKDQDQSISWKKVGNGIIIKVIPSHQMYGT